MENDDNEEQECEEDDEDEMEFEDTGANNSESHPQDEKSQWY